MSLGASVGSGFRSLGPVASAAGTAISNSFTAALNGVRRVSADAATAITSSLKGAGLAVAAGVAAATAGGFGRLSAIETAQAKLEALGNSTETVALILKNATDAVTGTQYSLADAATAAASAVAAGVKPGEELTQYLRLTANAAAITGREFSDMGYIINKTTTAGAAYTDDLNQVADAGVPIFQALAKEYGVSQKELRDMASKGEIDAKRFQKVLQETVGDGALAVGDTTTGAFKNMGAAFNRFGAGLLAGVYPIFQKVFATVTKGLDAITPAVTALSNAIGPSLQAAVGAGLDRLLGVFESLKGTLSGLDFSNLSGLSGIGDLFVILGR